MKFQQNATMERGRFYGEDASKPRKPRQRRGVELTSSKRCYRRMAAMERCRLYGEDARKSREHRQKRGVELTSSKRCYRRTGVALE
jgi:hypothetical protein